LTPLLLNIAIYNALIAQERSLGDTLVSIRGEIAVAGREPVAVDRRFSGAQAGQHAAAAVAIPVGTLLRSRFDDLNISGITLNLSSIDGSRTATLERITLDRTEVRPGETVNLQAFARTSSGRIFVQNIPVTIPSDTPAGTITISVGDGSAMQQNAAIKEFVPADLTELVRTMNKAKMPDRLYVQAFRTTRGAIIGASELPNLPPSVMATLNNQRTAGGVKPVVQTVVTEVRVDPAEFLIVGQQTLNLEVIR
jgi:hypothetical protein